MSEDAPTPIIGESPAICRARELVHRYAPTGLPILLVGATGTGKELFAQHIHHLSRRSGPLVDVNCGALPREMVESLLFGHHRGAFTGALESVAGHLERAAGGTLFLDELLHLPPESQVKLLRVLETGEVERLGEGRKRMIDFRLVAAVQDELATRLESGLFRRDLYQRVAGVVIHLPRLVDRYEDALTLAEHFAGVQGRHLESGCRVVLENYEWPGNVRELQLAIERAAHLVEDGTLSTMALTEAVQLGAPTMGQPSLRASAAKRVEARAHLFAVCEDSGWDVRRIAETLGIHRATVYRRLKQHRLVLPTH